jgi:hypothetical protein
MRGKPSRRRKNTRNKRKPRSPRKTLLLGRVYIANLPPDERVEVLRMLEPHHRMWDGCLGTAAATTHRIEVLPGSKPVHAQPYRAGSHTRVAEKTVIDRMLSQQVIEPVTCEWASPIVLVPKPDGTLRF